LRRTIGGSQSNATLVSDPRFDPLVGEFKKHTFRQQYGFLDAKKREELAQFQQSFKKTKDPEEKAKLQRIINKYKEEFRLQAERDKAKTLKTAWRERTTELKAQGKKPFYLSEGSQKALSLVEKYKTLNKSGKLDKFMAKKRKKNAAKDRKWIPDT